MHSHALKFVLPEDARPQALRDLQQMNISRTSLFPGMDGFAGSLSRSLFVLEQSSAFLADLADGLPDDFHL